MKVLSRTPTSTESDLPNSATSRLSEELVIKEARRRRRKRHRWVGGTIALTLLAVAATLFAMGGRPTSDSGGNGSGNLAPSPSAPDAATWRTTSSTVWHSGLPGNYLGFGPSTQLTCAAGNSSTCYVMVQGNGIWPNGTVSAPVPALAPLSTSVFESTDAGTNWKQLSLPDHTWLSSNLTCPKAATCEAGAIVGATAGSTPGQTGRAVLMTTIDGGQHWSVHRLPAWVGMLTSVSCPTSLNCAMLAWPRDANVIGGVQPYEGADRFYPTTILATGDGGATWSKATLPSAAPSVYYQLSSLTCPTTTRCVVLATRSHIVDSSDGYRQTDDAQLLLSSGNGGRSWTVASLPPTVAAHQLAPSAVACTTGQSRCFAVASPSLDSATQPTPVLLTSTTNNGPWTAVPSTGPTPVSDWGLADVEGTQPCLTNSFCAVVTSGSALGVTGNGELHWHASTLPPVPTGYESNNSVTQTSCLASGTCLALQDMTAHVAITGPYDDGARVLTDADRSSTPDS